MKTLSVTILGGSGYGGGELLRILLQHPHVSINQVTSRKWAKFPVSIVHPNLRNITKLKFCKPQELTECDVLFVALPNGVSQYEITEYTSKATTIIDLSADFRLDTEERYAQWYGDHAQPDMLASFTSGLAEFNRDNIASADLIACQGCEATSTVLALYPAYKHGLVETGTTSFVDAKIGSSAAGSHATEGSHHPERAGCLRSYKPVGHRHTAEVTQILESVSENPTVAISATAVNMVRGILSTCQITVSPETTIKDVLNAYKAEYADEPFVRLVTDKMGLYRFPEPKLLSGTNYCDIGFALDAPNKRLVVVSAIDNLVKGTSGQAVQAMNIRYNFAEETGLEFTGLHPI